MKFVLQTSLLSLLTATMAAHSATLTVNTASSANERDGLLSLTEAILVANGPDKGGIEIASLDAGEQAQIEGELGDSDLIAFNIPGDGPHIIPAPAGHGDGGFPAIRDDGLVIDGYTQPGASPNINGIDMPNNAVIQIVLDGRDGSMNNDVYAIIGATARDVVFKGLSILDLRGGDQGGGAGISFINGEPFELENALGGQIAGCWIGLHPDGQTLAGGELGVYFGGEIGETQGGHIIGTDGDGDNDPAEFNVIVGYGENIYSDGAPDVKISGNFIGILPDGVTPANASPADKGIEGILYHRAQIGTNSDGVSDSLEANRLGNLEYGIHIWGGVVFDAVVAGNIFGVAIDGSPLPINRWIDGQVWVNSRFGSNLDGIYDQIEANTVENITEFLIDYHDMQEVELDGRVSIRGNHFRNNIMARPGFENSYLSLNTGLSLDEARPVIDPSSSGASIQGSVPLHTGNADEFANVTAVYVDIYLADEATLPDNPQGAEYLGSFEVDGPFDNDADPGEFDFDVPALFAQTEPFSLTITANVEGGVSETFYTDTYLDFTEVERGIDTSPFSLAHQYGSTSVIDWQIF